MESIHTLRCRRPQDHPAYAVAEVLAELIAGGGRAISRLLDAAAQARRNARARRELHNLNDHFLRDIGLDRHQIDRLFG